MDQIRIQDVRFKSSLRQDIGVSLHIYQFLSVSDVLSKSFSSVLHWSLSFGICLFFLPFCPEEVPLPLHLYLPSSSQYIEHRSCFSPSRWCFSPSSTTRWFLTHSQMNPMFLSFSCFPFVCVYVHTCLLLSPSVTLWPQSKGWYFLLEEQRTLFPS